MYYAVAHLNKKGEVTPPFVESRSKEAAERNLAPNVMFNGNRPGGVRNRL